jgi:hypothetical protein
MPLYLTAWEYGPMAEGAPRQYSARQHVSRARGRERERWDEWPRGSELTLGGDDGVGSSGGHGSEVDDLSSGVGLRKSAGKRGRDGCLAKARDHRSSAKSEAGGNSDFRAGHVCVASESEIVMVSSVIGYIRIQK